MKLRTVTRFFFPSSMNFSPSMFVLIAADGPPSEDFGERMVRGRGYSDNGQHAHWALYFLLLYRTLLVFIAVVVAVRGFLGSSLAGGLGRGG